MSPRNNHFAAGIAGVLMGALCAVMVYLDPAQLRAPAWVAYLASAALALGGVAVALKQLPTPRIHAWLPVAILVALVAPALWLAFGAGERTCQLYVPLLRTVPSEFWCRAVPAAGSIIGIWMIVFAVRGALRARTAG